MKRFLKQFLYGLLYLSILTLIGFGVYVLFFIEKPTCFDNIQNQLETDVDCGPEVGISATGPFTPGGCLPCEIKTITLFTDEPRIFPVGPESSSIIVGVENKSFNYGLKEFDYSIEVISKLGTRLALFERSSYIAPQEKKYLIISNLNLDARDIASANLIFDKNKLNWLPPSSLSEKPNLEISDVSISGDGDEFKKIEGILTNNSSNNFNRIILAAFIYGNDNDILSVSTTELRTIKAFENYAFTIFLPDVEYKDIEIISDIIP
ncbi:MAG TPA: hypothetical protein VI432_01915 [Candidatus Paceibacterota bacterium]